MNEASNPMLAPSVTSATVNMVLYMVFGLRNKNQPSNHYILIKKQSQYQKAPFE